MTTDAKGGQIQNSSRANYNDTVFGPAFVELNSVGDGNLLVRFANQGAGTASGGAVTRNSHIGCLTNPDFRAWEQLKSTTGRFMMDYDAGAHMAIVNPLMGRPGTSGDALFYQSLSSHLAGMCICGLYQSLE